MTYVADQRQFHSVTKNGVSMGMVFTTREAAEANAESMNKIWKGQHTWGVVSWEATDCFTNENA
tara:strand:+ start:396 stop:587 length:192 start_codon:yes stop_codon:yes gene_type:complete